MYALTSKAFHARQLIYWMCLPV